MRAPLPRLELLIDRCPKYLQVWRQPGGAGCQDCLRGGRLRCCQLQQRSSLSPRCPRRRQESGGAGRRRQEGGRGCTCRQEGARGAARCVAARYSGVAGVAGGGVMCTPCHWACRGKEGNAVRMLSPGIRLALGSQLPALIDHGRSFAGGLDQEGLAAPGRRVAVHRGDRRRRGAAKTGGCWALLLVGLLGERNWPCEKTLLSPQLFCFHLASGNGVLIVVCSED